MTTGMMNDFYKGIKHMYQTLNKINENLIKIADSNEKINKQLKDISGDIDSIRDKK